MSEGFIQSSRLRREEQRFFLDKTEISGVQNISTSFNSTSSVLKFLGMNTHAPVIMEQGPQIGSFSLDANVVSRDFFLDLTGNTGFNGYIIRNAEDPKDNFSFYSGYLTNYSTSCQVGGIPQVSINVEVLGDVGRFSTNLNNDISGDLQSIVTGSDFTFPFKIAGYGSINLTLDDNFNSDRIQSYQINIDVSRTPVYSVGNRYPKEVNLNFPLEVTCDFQFEADNYEADRLRNLPCNQHINELTLVVNDVQDDSEILSYHFTELRRTSESYNISTDGNATYNLQYKTWIYETGAAS